ncbi:hypothetical protein D3C81_1357440 [compost metagenome]
MRAPPEAEKQISGQRFSSAYSAARTKRAPTTAPIEPPMKLNSKTQATTGRPCSLPLMAIRASFSPVSFWAATRRSLYFLLSRNLRRSTGSRSAPSSSRPSASRNMSRRARAPTRMWWSHFGQTSRVFSSSGRYSTASQAGHLCHRPSGTELFFTSERMMEGISLSTSQLLMLSFSSTGAGRVRKASSLAFVLEQIHRRGSGKNAANPLKTSAATGVALNTSLETGTRS